MAGCTDRGVGETVLQGHPDTSWEVSLPARELPSEMPEPALGINFARVGMAVISQAA